MDIKEEEKTAVCHALNVYLGDLRQEISRTEKYEMRLDLHREKDTLKRVMARC